MGSLEQEVAQIKRQLQSSQTLDEVPVKPVLQNVDKIGIYDKSSNQVATILFSEFVNQVASGNIIFEEELNSGTPTGNILIKQSGLTVLTIGKAGQTNEYSDLNGKPDLSGFITSDDLITDQNNQIKIIDLRNLDYSSGTQTKIEVVIQEFNALTTLEKTINERQIVFLKATITDTLIGGKTENLFSINRGKGAQDLVVSDIGIFQEKIIVDLVTDQVTLLDKKYQGNQVYATLITPPTPVGENITFTHNLGIDKYLRVEAFTEIVGGNIGSHADLPSLATNVIPTDNDLVITGWEFETNSLLYIEFTKV